MSDARRPPMDLDIDLDGSPWPPSFAATPLSPFVISSSPSLPPPSLLIGHPSSLLWIAEDTAAEVSSALIGDQAFFNDTTEKAYGAEENERQLRPAAEEHVEASCVIKERMTQALRCFKKSTDQHVLVQVWAPAKNGDRCILTTSGQPFVLDPQSTKLLQYRTVSLMYIFSVDEDEGDAYLGLPGRVFTKKMPEWTPNVQYYSSKEYQRLNYALLYNIQGTLALPVFEPSGQSCIAVVELVLTSQKVNYAYDVDKVCKALETVNLKSSEIMDLAKVGIANDGRQAALAGILEILTIVCEAQKLPLAQAWVPCRHRTILAHGGGLKKTCSSFDGSCMGQVCMSTTDVAFYIVDSHLWGFREACLEHHLQKGQGVAGMAFALRRPCFSSDITKYCKSQYPLVHYARMFKLAGCLAICLRSIYSGDDDYILEFFLPADCKSPVEQQDVLTSILALLKQCFQNMKIITHMEFQEAISLERVYLVTDDTELQCGLLSSQNIDTSLYVSPENNIWEAGENDKLANNKNEFLDLHEHHVTPDPVVKIEGNIISDSIPLAKKTSKTPGKRRGKAEKMISLDVLQQYFSGSLKDAARSLGVCPTTMKRICRHHGISRWPSRKINKVNRSLSKLKHVIESVQGDGSLDLTSLAGAVPATIDSVPWPVNLERLKNFEEDVKGREFSLEEPCDRDDLQKKSIPLQLNFDDADPQQGPVKDSRCSKSGSSLDDSMDSPTSQGSCQSYPVNEIFTSNQPPLDSNQALDVGSSSKFPLENDCDPNLPNENFLPSPFIVEPQTPVEMAIKDSESTKDLKNLLKNLCAFGRESSRDGSAMIPNDTALKNWAVQENNTLTIKASYKDDIIRFRLPIDAGVVALKYEISRRFKLDVGTFDIKYLDDDHEWVMLACDSDLEECIDISRSSGAYIIRLSVHDVVTNLGSSCESSEFDHQILGAKHFDTA